MANYQKAKDIFIQRKTTSDTFEEYPLIVSPNSILLTDNCSDLVMISTQSLLESSSYALTASYALVSGTGGGTSLSTGSTYPITASWAETASLSTSASYTTTASNAVTASYANTASVSISSSYSTTASYALNGGSGGVANITASSIATGSVTASVDVGASLFTIKNSGNTYLFISSSGNIGIGTTAPTAPLEIAQTQDGLGSLNGFYVRDLSNIQSNFTLKGGTGANSPRLIISSLSDALSAPIGGTALIQNSDLTNFYPVRFLASIINFETTPSNYANRVTRMTISSSGNVGIGTTLPTNKLDVVGNISCSVITSSIIATGTSLIIQSSTPTLNILSGSSAILITQSLSQSNAMGSSVYGVSFNQTMTNSTASQTQTAFRVLPTFAGNFTGSNTSNIIADFGATNVGTQFSVNDVTSGSIYMVNDVSGLPIIEALSDWQVNIYDYPNVLFNKSGSYLTLGSVAAPTSSVKVRSDYIFDKGVGVTYKQVQVSGSTYGAVTSSIYNLAFGNTSASVYLNAIITGYDTGSNDVITGDLKATVRYRNNVASVVGSITKFVNSDANVSFDLTASSNSASLMVYGSSSRYYKWGGTITTQVI